MSQIFALVSDHSRHYENFKFVLSETAAMVLACYQSSKLQVSIFGTLSIFCQSHYRENLGFSDIYKTWTPGPWTTSVDVAHGLLLWTNPHFVKLPVKKSLDNYNNNMGDKLFTYTTKFWRQISALIYNST